MEIGLPEKTSEQTKAKVESNNNKITQLNTSAFVTEKRLDDLRAGLGLEKPEAIPPSVVVINDKVAFLKNENTILNSQQERASSPDHIIDERILRKGIEDLYESFRPLINVLWSRRENNFDELISDSYIYGMDSDLKSLLQMDFTKPESFDNARQCLDRIARGIESISSQSERGAVRDDLDNLGYISFSLKKIQEGAGSIRSSFGKLSIPESQAIFKIAGHIQDAAENKIRYIYRRMDSLERR